MSCGWTSRLNPRKAADRQLVRPLATPAGAGGSFGLTSCSGRMLSRTRARASPRAPVAPGQQLGTARVQSLAGPNSTPSWPQDNSCLRPGYSPVLALTAHRRGLRTTAGYGRTGMRSRTGTEGTPRDPRTTPGRRLSHAVQSRLAGSRCQTTREYGGGAAGAPHRGTGISQSITDYIWKRRDRSEVASSKYQTRFTLIGFSKVPLPSRV